MAKTKDIELWERQPKESGEAWEAFLLYRDAGEKRHLNAVASQLQKSYTLIRRWKDRWFWEERVLAYDNELQKEELKAAKKGRREMNKRHTELSMRLQRAAAEALESKDFSKMSDKDIASFIRLAAELERTARVDDLRILEPENVLEEGGTNQTIQIFVPDNGRMRKEADDE